MKGTIVEHAMQTIANEGMTPVTKSADMNSGRTHAAIDLFEAYCVKAQNDARITVLHSLACVEKLSIKEFEKAMTDAIAQAAARDKVNGFAPAPDAKGRDKYGPLQSTMAQRASEARQIFGAYSMGLVTTKAGYVEVLKLARNALKAGKIDWTGASVEQMQAAAQADKERKAMAEATKKAMLSTPKLENQSQGEWFAQVAKNAEKMLAEAKAEKDTALVQAELERIVKKFEPADVYDVAVSLVKWLIDSQAISKDQVIEDIGSLGTEQA